MPILYTSSSGGGGGELGEGEGEGQRGKRLGYLLVGRDLKRVKGNHGLGGTESIASLIRRGRELVKLQHLKLK